jgi:carboxylesterase type B
MQSVCKMKSSCEVSFYFVIYFHFINFVFAEVLIIDEGRIDGSVLLNRWGEPFHAYRKIPFAEPPVGSLRFKAPVQKKPWKTVLDCTAYGPMCFQDDFWNGTIAISEDCLHLNVFTKNLPSLEFQFKELKPVIAFLHGGGFEAGSALEYGPEYLMERE